MAKIAIFRLRALDKELAEILHEADGRCATEFALSLDSLRERLQVPITASSRTEARIHRKHADQDGKGNPLVDERGAFKFTTADQQEALMEAMTDFLQSTIDIPDDLPKITKRQLVNNGLATSGMRLANLRPVLDATADEPAARNYRDERAIVIQPPRGTPHA